VVGKAFGETIVLIKAFAMSQPFNLQGIGLVLMRLFIGVRLIYGVQDNVLHWERMQEFEAFLAGVNFPFPLVCAFISVYVQLFAGLMILLGWKIRWAAAVMVFNFLVALIMVHREQNLEQMTPPLAMLFGSLLFLFEGAGPYSLAGRTNRSSVVLKPQEQHGYVQRQRERIGDNNGHIVP
jgi:putative oxidoreductase